MSLAGSWSYVALRGDRDDVLEAIRDLVATHPDLAGRDRFALPYVTNAFPGHAPAAGVVDQTGWCMIDSGVAFIVE